MSISEIAGSLAFSNVSYFTNVFTKNEGVSPGNFRASERGLLHDHHTTMSKNCK
jgi:AraC-like DNA-binding protein